MVINYPSAGLSDKKKEAMKKTILFISMMMLLDACGLTYVTYQADITLLGNNGEVIRKYEDAVIGKEVHDGFNYQKDLYSYSSSFGLDFIDNQYNPVHIRGGIIIIDNVKFTSEYEALSYTKEERADIESKTKKYNLLKLNIQNNEEEIAKSTDDRYIRMKKEQTLKMKAEIADIRYYMLEKYHKTLD